MPFPIQVLGPKYVSREPLTAKLGDDHLEAVFNGTAANIIRQLSSLATVAQRIFFDLNAQLKEIQNRTEKLQGKVANVDIIVTQLDAKQVPIPAGSLDEFSRLQTHYVCSNTVDKCLFTTDSRPECVRRVYDEAVPSPVRLVRTIDHYRKDGQRSSSLFLCMPFFKDIRVPYDVDIEMRRPTSLSSATCRGWKSEGEEDSLALDTTREDEEDRDEVGDKSMDSGDGTGLEATLLPTPDEKIYVNSLKFPQADVVVDVSGRGFRRMTSLRRSFIHQMEQLNNKRKKKKRRCTVAGEQVTDTVKDASVTKVNEGAGPSGESTKNQKENKEVQTCFEEAKEKEKSSTGFQRWFQRKPRSRNSIIGGLAIYEELDRVKKSKRRSIAGSLWIHSNHSSSSCSPSKSSTDSAVATGTSSVSDTNLATLKSTGVKLRVHGKSHRVKREDGGQSSSGNWSASSSTRTSMESEDPIVTTAGTGENQLLLMTATSTLPRCYGRNEKKRNTSSQCSSGKASFNSGKSSQRDRCTEGSSGYLSDGPHYRSSIARRSLPPRMANSATVTARWLRSLEEEGGGPLCSETTDATSSTGTLTPRIHRHQRPISPLVFGDDGESSEFSVDTDGYYTSMHTDSGLRSLNPQVTVPNASRLSDLREHGSNSTLSSVSSGRTTSSSSSKKATTSSEDTSNKDSCDATVSSSKSTDESVKKKVPPPPPPRVSTRNGNLTVETSLDSSIGEDDRSRKMSTASDSDADAGERLELKTKMNSDRIPSLCVVTPSASDDETADDTNKIQAAAVGDDFINNKSFDLVKVDTWADPGKSGSCYHSLPRTAQDKDAWRHDQRAYRTLPRNYNREMSYQITSGDKPSSVKPSTLDENRNTIISAPNGQLTNPGLPRSGGAHVTLDPTGKVIHVSGSLPRRFIQNNNVPNTRISPPVNNGHLPINYAAPLNSLNTGSPASKWSSVNSTGDYGSNTFPRWRPNGSVTPSAPTSASNCRPMTSYPAENAPRRWNNFGFLKRDPSHSPRAPVGAYVRMDGHPEHLEPGSLSRTLTDKEPCRNVDVQRANVKETASNEELSNNTGVPTPPVAMPLLQNTNYGHASRIPTRTMPMINSSPNVLPPYYAPVETRCSVVTTQPSTNSTGGRVSAPPTMLTRGPAVDYKTLSPAALSSHNQPIIPSSSSPIATKPRPPVQQTTPNATSYNRINSQANLHPPNGLNASAPRLGSAPRTLFPSPTASTDQWSPSARPLTINTYNQRPAQQPYSTPPHMLSPKRTSPSMPPPRSPTQQQQTSAPNNKLSSMTTDQLFAAIHQSKKKMNIKTDLDTSISPTATTNSSRSNSPCLKSPVTSSGRPETGTLSPRPQPQPPPPTEGKPGDRRSWALGDSSSPSTTSATTPIEVRSAGDRRSWASDRLGPSKPTSLHDFKLLLLQAGRGNSPLSYSDRPPSRKSAAEMLKTGSPNQSVTTSTLPNPNKARLVPQSCALSSTIPGRSPSPKTLVPLSRSLNGHSLGRMRANCSVLHNRTDILSTPIPEDEGSEDEYESEQTLGLPSKSSAVTINSTPLMAVR